jgi:hypothetical protein
MIAVCTRDERVFLIRVFFRLLTRIFTGLFSSPNYTNENKIMTKHSGSDLVNEIKRAAHATMQTRSIPKKNEERKESVGLFNCSPPSSC